MRKLSEVSEAINESITVSTAQSKFVQTQMRAISVALGERKGKLKDVPEKEILKDLIAALKERIK